MEYFTACSLCRGKVLIDGIYRGETREGNQLNVFECQAGLHDITLEYQNGGPSKKKTRRVMIAGTTRVRPMLIPFICEL